jgi:hypothetical protein
MTYTLAAEGNLSTNSANDNDVNVLVIIVIPSVIGIALGAGIMYLLRKK